MSIDVDALRDYMRDYYGTAIFAGISVAMIDVAKVERVLVEELIKLALKEHVDLSKYSV